LATEEAARQAESERLECATEKVEAEHLEWERLAAEMAARDCRSSSWNKRKEVGEERGGGTGVAGD
jgi:hypothetical protein